MIPVRENSEVVIKLSRQQGVKRDDMVNEDERMGYDSDLANPVPSTILRVLNDVPSNYKRKTATKGFFKVYY
jgi:hypothetical protein